MAPASSSSSGVEPRKLPKRVAKVLFESAEVVELHIKVSEKSNILTYGFTYGGVVVPIHNDEGKFFATPDTEQFLAWVMIGDPGGTMKVEVTRNERVLYNRPRSRIPPPLTKGYDRFRIKVSQDA